MQPLLTPCPGPAKGAAPAFSTSSLLGTLHIMKVQVEATFLKNLPWSPSQTPVLLLNSSSPFSRPPHWQMLCPVWLVSLQRILSPFSIKSFQGAGSLSGQPLCSLPCLHTIGAFRRYLLNRWVDQGTNVSIHGIQGHRQSHVTSVAVTTQPQRMSAKQWTCVSGHFCCLQQQQLKWWKPKTNILME